MIEKENTNSFYLVRDLFIYLYGLYLQVKKDIGHGLVLGKILIFKVDFLKIKMML